MAEPSGAGAGRRAFTRAVGRGRDQKSWDTEDERDRVGSSGEVLREGLGLKVFKDLERKNIREEDCLSERFKIPEYAKATDSICDLQTSLAQI